MQKNILLATSNLTKRTQYTTLFRGISTVYVPADVGFVSMHVEETLDDAAENARRKSLRYSEVVGDIAVLGEDTALDVPAFNHAPGPAIRRWGGALPETVSDESWLEFFVDVVSAEMHTRGVASLPCTKSMYYCLSRNGCCIDEYMFSIPFEIRLPNVHSAQSYNRAPLSHALFSTSLNKFESDFTADDTDSLLHAVRLWLEKHL
ncbi:MAG: hypothetical protein RLZZ283_267 [Candidatus Parcubacteria bacterium]|jgi:hypothetical protein